jgi:hypothetical protein
MVNALTILLHEHPNLKEIDHTFCCPGHSSIQEVDNIHSSIEKALKVCEVHVYSPPGFVGVLTNVRQRYMKAIKLKTGDFCNYQKTSKNLKYSEIQLKKVKAY